MMGPLPRVSALGADMKTHSWCVVDSKLDLGPAVGRGVRRRWGEIIVQ
jgi:hypothetical protein